MNKQRSTKYYTEKLRLSNIYPTKNLEGGELRWKSKQFLLQY